MTALTPAQGERAATRLANLYAAWRDAAQADRGVRPSQATKLAWATFDGAVQAVSVITGCTQGYVSLAVAEAERSVGPRPALTSSARERKAWIAAMVPAVLVRWGQEVTL